jgi:hypothetical protein
MRSLGIRIMNLTSFLLLSKSNSKIDGNQITFGAVDFQTHPPILALVFTNLDQEMNLMIGSFNFCIESLQKFLHELFSVKTFSKILCSSD